MTSARFTWKGDEWAKGVLPGALAKAINAGAAYTEGKFKNALGRKRGLMSPANPPGSPPASRTGELSKSIASTKAMPGRYYSRIGPTITYARIQEFGGTITAKTSKYLTIPLNYRARKIRQHGNVNLRTLEGHVVRSKAGNLLLIIPAQKGTGKSKSTGDGIFLLKERVTLPPRPFIRPTFERSKPEIINRIRNSLRANLRAAV